jgi:hypothetical protein
MYVYDPQLSTDIEPDQVMINGKLFIVNQEFYHKLAALSVEENFNMAN